MPREVKLREADDFLLVSVVEGNGEETDLCFDLPVLPEDVQVILEAVGVEARYRKFTNREDPEYPEGLK